MPRTKIVFLYTELAGYFLACVNELSKNAEILIVRWPVNQEAPFVFDEISSIKIIDRDEMTDDELKQKIHQFKPDILVCSGWLDKGYLRIVKSFKKKITTVLTLDNHWKGSLKQQIAAFISPFYLKTIFTHAWVPGESQAAFANKLGFGKNTIRNFYCADTNHYDKIYKATFDTKTTLIPKRFLFAARYVKHKGIEELWKAFTELQNESPNDWELWCLGTGSEWDTRVIHPKIKHFGFVQPGDMQQYISETSVYVLPSKFEPWGVAVQEFAICGFPLLLSDKVGAKEKYLSKNGFVFEHSNINALKLAMKKIMESSDVELINMGKVSHELGMSLTISMWIENLLSLKK